MGILVDESTRLLVQGITGVQGRFHTERMIQYGTKVVAGVTPLKGGQEVEGVPVYDTVRKAVEEEEVNASIIFVPARFAADSLYEAIEAGVKTIVCITEGLPMHDMMNVRKMIEESDVTLVGPNSPGIITPGESKVGIMPGHIFMKGDVGVASRSGTLTYQIVNELTEHGFGQSSCIGIGGDPVVGTSFIDTLQMFEDDPETKAVVMIGEIGGKGEEEAAVWIEDNMTKPVVGFVAGRTAPPERRMGHAGAIVSRGKGTAESKIKALRDSGVLIAETPAEVSELIASLF